jgi:hypothetical protein
MKLFAILLASALLVSTPALAQNGVIQFSATCVNIETLADILKEFQEDPAMTMLSNRPSDDEFVTNALVLFINYKTKTWTMAERIPGNRYCVIATGENISPYFPK